MAEPATLTFRTPEAAAINTRFEKIDLMTDPAAILLELEDIKTKSLEIHKTEKEFHDAKPDKMGLGFVGGAALGIAISVMFISSFGLGFFLTGLLAITGAVTGGVAAIKPEIDYDQKYLDFKRTKEINETCVKKTDEMTRSADIRQIAASPKGLDVFMLFPILKEKFQLAALQDRMFGPAAPTPAVSAKEMVL